MLDLMQPRHVSVGHAGIQDQIIVHRPDANGYRFHHPIPPPPGLILRLAWKLGLLSR